jgi:hypothetical protein
MSTVNRLVREIESGSPSTMPTLIAAMNDMTAHHVAKTQRLARDARATRRP